MLQNKLVFSSFTANINTYLLLLTQFQSLYFHNELKKIIVVQFLSKKNILILSSSVFLFCGCSRQLNLNQPDNRLPPAAPEGLEVYSASDGEIILDWHANNDNTVNGYNIYRSSDSVNFNFINFTQNNYYYDDSLEYNIEYKYYITAVNIFNRESAQSDTVAGMPVNRYSPSTPYGLKINARNWDNMKSVYLQWQPNFESDVRRYNIYRSIEPGFTADTTSYIGFSSAVNYSDTLNLSIYTVYYYRIKAVDNGGLKSSESSQVNDQIFPVPQLIFPADGSSQNYFSQFLIQALQVPATYQVVVQTNQYFGEFYNNQIYSTVTNDTLAIDFSPVYLYGNITYYWRVITFSNSSGQANSISPLYSFTLVQ